MEREETMKSEFVSLLVLLGEYVKEVRDVDKINETICKCIAAANNERPTKEKSDTHPTKGK